METDEYLICTHSDFSWFVPGQTYTIEKYGDKERVIDEEGDRMLLGPDGNSIALYAERIRFDRIPSDEEPDDNTFDVVQTALEDTLVDMVEHNDIVKPSHYADYAIEPITFIMKNGIGFAAGNVIKYVARAGRKIEPGKSAEEMRLKDLKKAKRYIEMMINEAEGKDVL